jgi:hypothetical protein
MANDGDLILAMLAVAFAALVVVIGELYIVNKPAAIPSILVPQQQLDRAPPAESPSP